MFHREIAANPLPLEAGGSTRAFGRDSDRLVPICAPLALFDLSRVGPRASATKPASA